MKIRKLKSAFSVVAVIYILLIATLPFECAIIADDSHFMTIDTLAQFKENSGMNKDVTLTDDQVVHLVNRKLTEQKIEAVVVFAVTTTAAFVGLTIFALYTFNFK